MQDKKSRIYILSVIFFLIIHIFVWYYAKDKQARWINVPPVPSVTGLTQMGLGDVQFALRVSGLNLQNMGDGGGRVTNLKEYNYERLEQWLNLSFDIDPLTNFFPMIAAYYYGGTKNPDQARHIVSYLEKSGDSIPGEKWRWLAQAVFLARYTVNDSDLALRLAYKLADLAKNDPELPEWTRQMPAFVLTAKGNKQAARDIMETILLSDLKNLDINEINYMCMYIKERLSEGTSTIYKNSEVSELCKNAR